MRLPWASRKPSLKVEAFDGEIKVSLPGSSFSVTYQMGDNGQLVATAFHSQKLADEKLNITFPKFLSVAWEAANRKARAIGWLT